MFILVTNCVRKEEKENKGGFIEERNWRIEILLKKGKKDVTPINYFSFFLFITTLIITAVFINH